jgi:salicylate hydroxylase
VRRVVVVGGGIGGLTAALALRAVGCEVVVIERAERFGEIGAGVQLGPNATRVLRGLGLAGELGEVGVHPPTAQFLRWRDGAVLGAQPLAEQMEQRFGAPYYTLYRPDLIEVLAAKLPAGVVRFGTAVTEVRAEPGQRPSVHLADGTSESADIVVGADGTHSAVRSSTVGDVPARFSGMCAYRALVPREAVDADAAAVVQVWLGPGRHLVAYPVGRQARYLNLVCVVPDPDWSTESWTAPGSADQLRAHFQDWSPRPRRLLESVSEPVFRWALYDREPLTGWSAPGTTLMGDACHPMLPFLAQGAAQAIEDAAALAVQLRDPDIDAGTALHRYEQARLPHTARIQRLSWENNTVYHLPDGPEQERRDAAYGAAGSGPLESMAWMYGNDATQHAA